MASTVENTPRAATITSSNVRVPWVPILWFTGLLIACYFPILDRLVNIWLTDDDVGHGFFVPLVAAYVAWQRKDEILNTRLEPAWWGSLFIFWGALQAYLGTLGAELFLQRTAFLVSIVGVLLMVGGKPLVKALLFPLCLLPFMIPLPAIVYSRITFPLQLFASETAETVLTLLGRPVIRDGNILELASQKLSVVEACSGIRSLLSLTFLSLIYAYFFDHRVWMRWALLLGIIPIAVFANAGRVTITGILSDIDVELARGVFHSVEGWVIFAIALLLLIILHRVLLFIARRFEKPVAVNGASSTETEPAGENHV